MVAEGERLSSGTFVAAVIAADTAPRRRRGGLIHDVIYYGITSCRAPAGAAIEALPGLVAVQAVWLPLNTILLVTALGLQGVIQRAALRKAERRDCR